MRTFYDWRDTDFQNPTKNPLQGHVIFRTKNWWLVWIYIDSNPILRVNQTLRHFVVAPKSIYLYNCYLAKNFWDGLKTLIKYTKNGKIL